MSLSSSTLIRTRSIIFLASIARRMVCSGLQNTIRWAPFVGVRRSAPMEAPQLVSRYWKMLPWRCPLSRDRWASLLTKHRQPPTSTIRAVRLASLSTWARSTASISNIFPCRTSFIPLVGAAAFGESRLTGTTSVFLLLQEDLRFPPPALGFPEGHALAMAGGLLSCICDFLRSASFRSRFCGTDFLLAILGGL